MGSIPIRWEAFQLFQPISMFNFPQFSFDLIPRLPPRSLLASLRKIGNLLTNTKRKSIAKNCIHFGNQRPLYNTSLLTLHSPVCDRWLAIAPLVCPSHQGPTSTTAALVPAKALTRGFFLDVFLRFDMYDLNRQHHTK